MGGDGQGVVYIVGTFPVSKFENQVPRPAERTGDVGRGKIRGMGLLHLTRTH